MSGTGKPRIIVIRRRGGGGDHGHHGGAWKVAYADFVTAMMAFFLLLWLLNATSEEQRKGLADYFDPTLPISPVSAGGSGILGGEDLYFPPPRSGSVPVGVQPRRGGMDPGPNLGDDVASPESVPEPGDADSQSEGPTAEGPPPASADRAAIERAEALATELDDEHLTVRIDRDGLVIEIADLADEPLFATGSARPTPVLEELLALVADAVADTINPIAVIGHTDASPFAGATYTNWELSADRANAARRILVGRGVPDARIAHVMGKAATAPVEADPLAPRNRRIAVKLLAMPGR